jgi:hypothetical protein
MKSCGNETCDVRHIYHKVCADLVSDLTELCEINNSGICACACNDELGLALKRGCADLIVVDKSRISLYAIGNDVEIFTRNVYGKTVGNVSAVSKVHGKNGVTGGNESKECGKVCVSSAMGLNVSVLRAEKTASALTGDVLDLVDKLTAAVVARCGITLGVLVGKYSSCGKKNCLGNDILGCDKLDVALLTLKLSATSGGYVRVKLG